MKDAILLVQTLFKPGDKIWIGERYDTGIMGETIRSREEWITHIQNGGKTGPHIIINPLTGELAPSKTGDKLTYRGDNCVASYDRCLVEFDNLSRQDQIRFWTAAKLPVLALIDTGGKSIHAWLDVKQLADVKTAEEWQAEIEGKLYNELLIPMGVDRGCHNPSRLSRLPGFFREETGKYQRLLWLSADGRRIAA